jgi:hypothetical protein
VGTRARASANPGREGLKATATGVLVGLLLGPLVGALWLWVAPTPTAINTEGLIFLKDQNTSEFIAADGWFLIVGLVVGALSGGVLFWVFRRRPIATVIGITLGGLAGAWIAWKVGERLGPDPLEETASGVPEGGTIAAPINLRAKVVLLGWPLGGVIAFVSLYAGLTKPQHAVPVPVPAGGPPPLPGEAPGVGGTGHPDTGLPATPPPPRRAAPIRPISRPGQAAPLGPPPSGSAQNGPVQNGPVQNGPVQNGPPPNSPTPSGSTHSGPTPSGPTHNGPVPNGRGPSVGADGRPGEFGPGQGR